VKFFLSFTPLFFLNVTFKPSAPLSLGRSSSLDWSVPRTPYLTSFISFENFFFLFFDPVEALPNLSPGQPTFPPEAISDEFFCGLLSSASPLPFFLVLFKN